MPRVHEVKHARKDYPEIGVKKGEPYFWYSQKIMSGGRWYGRKTRTKDRPKPSDLVQSEFVRTIMSIQQDANFSGQESFGDLETQRDQVVSDLESLKDETQEKLDNMPEGLRENSASGQLLQERVDGLESVIDELGAVDIPNEEPPSDESDESFDDAGTDYADRVAAVAQELDDALSNLPG